MVSINSCIKPPEKTLKITLFAENFHNNQVAEQCWHFRNIKKLTAIHIKKSLHQIFANKLLEHTHTRTHMQHTHTYTTHTYIHNTHKSPSMNYTTYRVQSQTHCSTHKKEMLQIILSIKDALVNMDIVCTANTDSQDFEAQLMSLQILKLTQCQQRPCSLSRKQNTRWSSHKNVYKSQSAEHLTNYLSKLSCF